MTMRTTSRSMLYAVVLGVVVASAHAQTPDHPGLSKDHDRADSDSTTRGRAPLLLSQAGPGKIANQVIDLLDSGVSLDTEASRTLWESEPFRTSQANRIGIRVDVEMESGSIQCWTGWQFTADDEFLPGFPTTWAPLPYIGDDIGTIGDDAGIRGERPDARLFYGSPGHFTEVYGLRAKIVCQANPGPDFGGGAAPGRGTISDVKVLLRRE